MTTIPIANLLLLYVATIVVLIFVGRGRRSAISDEQLTRAIEKRMPNLFVNLNWP